MATDDKIVQHAAVALQGAAGQTTLVAAVAGQVIKLVACELTLDAAGTLKFQSNSNDLSGAMAFPTGGGPTLSGDVDSPLLETVAGEALKMTTTVGKAAGWVQYYVEGE